MTLIQEITDLSHEFGTTDYVRGGGGNTSAKTADTLWVKPSGTTLAGLTPDRFVAMDRAKLGRLYTTESPTLPAEREGLVKDLMAAAVKPDSSGRASVEAPLHDSFAARFVVHTHPALVNGLTCAQDGEAACRRLFPEALWVPYIDPGYTLCMEVRALMKAYTLKNGREPSLLLLENHGVFIAGDSSESIRSQYRHVMQTLEKVYTENGIAMTLRRGELIAEAERAPEMAAIQSALGADAKCLAAGAPRTLPIGPVSPDHIVYAKSFPYVGPLTPEGFEAFRRERGYAPKVVGTARAVYGVAGQEKQAALALEFAEDGALVLQLAEAFGGIRYMTDAARLFIENWEVESYRQKQMG